MNEHPPVYRSFEDLEVYKAMREFRQAMYQVAKRFPDSEKFGLAPQIRRAAVSLTNNLAQGHGRYHFLDQIKFTLISRGSLAALIDDLNICSDENYLPSNEVATMKDAGWQVLKLTNGYLRYLRDRKLGSSLEQRAAPTSCTAAIDNDESMKWLNELLEQHPEFLPALNPAADHQLLI
jgi:four helix bundle protein